MNDRQQEVRLKLAGTYNAIADALEAAGYTDYCMISAFALAAGLEPAQAVGLADVIRYDGSGLYTEDLQRALTALGIDGNRAISDDVATTAIVGADGDVTEEVVNATYEAAEAAFEAIGQPRDFDPANLYSLEPEEVEQWLDSCNAGLRNMLPTEEYGIEAIERKLGKGFYGIASAIGHAFPIVDGVIVDWEIFPAITESAEGCQELEEWLTQTRVIYVTALNPTLLDGIRAAVPQGRAA